MAWESEFRDLIEAASGVNADWGAPLDNSEYPLVTINLISDPVKYLVDSDIEIRRALVQVDCWSEVYDDALSARKAVETALLNFDTGMEIDTIEIVIIRGGSSREDQDLVYRQTLDVRIFYKAN